MLSSGVLNGQGVRHYGLSFRSVSSPMMPLQKGLRLPILWSKKSTPNAYPVGMAVIPSVAPREYGGRSYSVQAPVQTGLVVATLETAISLHGNSSCLSQLNLGKQFFIDTNCSSSASLESKIIGVIKSHVQIGAQPSAFDIAQAVWSQGISGFTGLGSFGVTLKDLIKLAQELHKIQGLDASNPMTVTQTKRSAGDVSLNISGDGITSTTVTRTT